MNTVTTKALKQELEMDIRAYAGAKKQLDELEASTKALAALILEKLDALGQKSMTFDAGDGIQHKVTKKQGSKLVIDEERLKKELGSQVWNKVTKRVLDDSKLEAAVANGKVDPVTVSQCSEVKKHKPYISLYTKAFKT